MIESSANLGMFGQGLLKLSGPGDTLRAQRLFVSLFYNVHVSGDSGWIWRNSSFVDIVKKYLIVPQFFRLWLKISFMIYVFKLSMYAKRYFGCLGC